MTNNSDKLQPSQLWLIAFMGALTALPALSTDMYLPALPSVAADLNASAGAVTSGVAVFFLGLAFGQLLFGPLSDRYGRRPPLLAGICLYVLASVSCAFADDVRLLVFMRFLQGAGGCATVVIGMAIVRDLFAPQIAARVMSYMSLVVGIAPILAPTIGSAVILVADWRTIFWILASCGVVCLVAAYFVLPETRTHAVSEQAKFESPLQAYRALVRDKRVMAFVVVSSLGMGAVLTYISNAAYLFIEAYGVSPQAFAWILGINAMALVGARQINAKLLVSRSFVSILRVATRVGVVAAVLLLFFAATSIGGMFSVMAMLFVLVGATGFIGGNAMAGAMAPQPQRAGSAAALAGFVQFVVAAGAASIAGFLYDGSALAIASVMLVALAGAALVLRFHIHSGVAASAKA